MAEGSVTGPSVWGFTVMHESEVYRLVLRPTSWRVSRLEQSICRTSPSVAQKVEQEVVSLLAGIPFAVRSQPCVPKS